MRSRVAIVVLAALALVGCTQAPPVLPAGVTVSVFQNRFDYGERQLELKVSNASDASITITEATFESTRFTVPAVWTRPQTLEPGAARDLVVQLAPPACDGADAVDRVILAFTTSDGRSGTASVIPTDETGRLAVITAEDCVGVALARHAVITGPTDAVWTPGARKGAVIELELTPTRSNGSATVVRVAGTVLLSLLDASGAEVYSQPLAVVLDAKSAASVIRLVVVPARCDPHAVEEDKRGTFIPLDVETSDGPEGRIYVAMSDAVRESLYRFYNDYCGLP